MGVFKVYQWRPEGLQRPGANACIGAPPPELAPPLAPPFGKTKPFGPVTKIDQRKNKKI